VPSSSRSPDIEKRARAIKRIILHIGRHKSGTSSLQRFFHDQSEVLAQKGILYPKAGRVGNGIAHHALARAVLAGDSERQQLITNQILSECDARYHTLLISSESFQDVLSPKRMSAFLANFPNAQIDIVSYYREFADYMMSAFRQATQNQSVFRIFQTFLDHSYPVKKQLKTWSGLGSLKTKWFHPELLVDGDIVKDFVAILDLGIYVQAHERRNASIGGNILFLKLAANHAGQDLFDYQMIDKVRRWNSYNRALIKHIGEVPLKNWDDLDPLPDPKNLEQDIGLIAETFPHINRADLTRLGDLSETAKNWF